MPSFERIAYGRPDAPYRELYTGSAGVAAAVPVVVMVGIVAPELVRTVLQLFAVPLLLGAFVLSTAGAYRGVGVATSAVVAIGPLLVHAMDYAFGPLLEGTGDVSLFAAVLEWLLLTLSLASIVGTAAFVVGSGLRGLRLLAPDAPDEADAEASGDEAPRTEASSGENEAR